MAVDDLELLLEQNMLVARHRGHSMPAKMNARCLDYHVPMKGGVAEHQNSTCMVDQSGYGEGAC
jgi:hypothetical protein